MWNITISISELSRIIKEVCTFYNSYPLETKVTLTKLRFQLNNNIFPPVNASIDVEETAHTINPLIIIVNLIETFIDLYKFFFLYRVEIIEKARGIGVYDNIIKTLFFVGMLLNIGLVFFHQNEKENFITIIFIIVVFENVLYFINLLNINAFLPFWYLNLSEIKSLYDKKYFSRDSNIMNLLNNEKEEEI